MSRFKETFAVVASVFITGYIRFLRGQQARNGHVPNSPAFSPKSILVVEVTRLGDVVAMLPAVESLKRAFPQAHITVALQDGYALMLKFVPCIDSVIPLDGTRTFGGLMRARKIVRSREFDLACSMSPAARNAVLTLSAKAHVKIGYLDAAQSETPFLDKSAVTAIGLNARVAPVYERENISVRAAKVLAPLGIPAGNHVTWSIPEAAKSNPITQIRDGRDIRPLVVVHPFAEWKFREWGLERFLSVGQSLAGSHSVVFAGTEAEFERTGALPGSIEKFIIRDAGELAALLSQASLFIGGDSGPLHLAASLGTPAVGLFGPAEPAFTGPRETSSLKMFYHRMECSPCRQVTCVHADRPCLSNIGEGDVIAAARELLQIEKVPA